MQENPLSPFSSELSAEKEKVVSEIFNRNLVGEDFPNESSSSEDLLDIIDGDTIVDPDYVPSGSTSSDENGSDGRFVPSEDKSTEKSVRKRKKCLEKWKKNINKRKRIGGEEYFGRGGKIVKEKIMQLSCNCRKKCQDLIPQDVRKSIHKLFWDKNFNWEQKDGFIASTVHAREIMRQRPRNDSQKGITNMHCPSMILQELMFAKLCI